jgi:hypothetical protein
VRLLLGDADEDHPLAASEPSAMLGGDVLLAGATLEVDEGDLLRSGEGFGGLDEGLAHLLEQRGRGDRVAAVLGEEGHQLARHLERRDVTVEIQPVQALDLEGHMVAQQLVDGRHGAPPSRVPAILLPAPG